MKKVNLPFKRKLNHTMCIRLNLVEKHEMIFGSHLTIFEASNISDAEKLFESSPHTHDKNIILSLVKLKEC
jgi:hypothetical protein